MTQRALSVLAQAMLWLGVFWGMNCVASLDTAAQDRENAVLSEGEVVFADPFENQLANGWMWLRQEPARWCIRDRGLEIRVWPGFADTVENALLWTVPDRGKDLWSFEVTVTNLKAPVQQWEQAGLTWYSDKKPVFKLVKELVDGRIVIMPGKVEIQDVPVQLRLDVQGQEFKAFYRTNFSEPYLLAGQGSIPAGKEEQISAQCYHGPDSAEHWIRFTNFRVLRTTK